MKQPDAITRDDRLTKAVLSSVKMPRAMQDVSDAHYLRPLNPPLFGLPLFFNFPLNPLPTVCPFHSAQSFSKQRQEMIDIVVCFRASFAERR